MFVALALALAAVAQNQPVRAPVRLDAGAGGAFSLAGDAAGGLHAVAWSAGPAGADGVWCAVSRNGGRAWTAPVRLDGGAAGFARRVQEGGVTVVDGEIRVCWLDERAGAADLWFRASRDGGASWEAEQRVDDGHAAGVAEVRLARVTTDAGGAFLAMALCLTGLPGGDEVRVVRSTDGGRSFSNASLLHAGGSAPRADLAVVGTAVHLVWMDDVAVPGIHAASYQRSLDGGATWLPALVAISGAINVMPESLRIAAAGARVAVVFQDLFAIHAVGANHSSDGGASWLPIPLRVANSRSPSVTPALPRLFFAPGLVLVAWADDRTTPGTLRPWLAWTADSGATWSERGLGNLPGAAPWIAGDSADGTFATVWRAGDKLRASVSRAATPEPMTPFVAAGAAALAGFGAAYDPEYAHHFACWLDGAPGAATVWAGGWRAPFVEPQGFLGPGTALHFTAHQFRRADAGREFRVLLAGAAGSARLPFGDGRLLGLAPDAWLTATAGAPALRGVLDASGGGSTGTATIPPGVAAGSLIHYAAVVFDPPTQSFGDLADARTFLVN
jgi:hypothetical protein